MNRSLTMWFLGRLAGLLMLTVFALVLMASLLLSDGNPLVGDAALDGAGANGPADAVVVSARRLEQEPIEVVERYSGMIRPWERYTLAFETSGRLTEFGENVAGRPLDEGDAVAVGQVLARIDSRVLAAQLKEVKANREKAQSDLNRVRDLRERSSRAITDEEYQNYVTQLELADARFEMAEKQLDDAMLRSPAAGFISRRFANVGESINVHQPIFEVVEVEQVLLVIGVPESRIREIREGQPVRVQFLGSDRYGRGWPDRQGEVFQVSQTADDKSGLFEVEVTIPNADGAIRPGSIGVADVIVDRFEGYRIPLTSGIFRGDDAFIYTIDAQRRAHEYELVNWIEQGAELLVAELPEAHRTVVTRGQHRLAEGDPVRIVALPEGDLGPMSSPGLTTSDSSASP